MREGAEGLMSNGSAGGGEVCCDGTGASERIPSSLFPQLPQTMAMPESERDTRGQPRERPDPASSSKPTERSGPKGEVSLGSQTPESCQLALTVDVFGK